MPRAEQRCEACRSPGGLCWNKVWGVFLFQATLAFCLVGFQNQLPRPSPADVFCFLVLLFSRKQDSHFRCVPDRVGDEVFLADLVTLLQRVHAWLVQSCSCFPKHALGLLPRHPGCSCVVLQGPALSGQTQPGRANVTLGTACSAGGGRGHWTARVPGCPPGMEGSLPASETVRLWLSPLRDGSGAGAALLAEPWVSGDAQAGRFCCCCRCCWNSLCKRGSASCCLLRHQMGEIERLLSVLS